MAKLCFNGGLQRLNHFRSSKIPLPHAPKDACSFVATVQERSENRVDLAPSDGGETFENTEDFDESRASFDDLVEFVELNEPPETADKSTETDQEILGQIWQTNKPHPRKLAETKNKVFVKENFWLNTLR